METARGGASEYDEYDYYDGEDEDRYGHHHGEEDDDYHEEDDDDEEEEEDWQANDDFRVCTTTSSATSSSAAKKKPRKKKNSNTMATMNSMTENNVETAVAEWRAASRRERFIDPQACQLVLRLVLAHLKRRYAAHFVTSTASGASSSSVSTAQASGGGAWHAHVPVDKVEVVFTSRGKEIQCQPGSGRIEFGMHTIKQEFYDGASSRYALENDFMNKVCRTKEDVLMWFMLHEFCHLFRGGERHGHTFFNRVLALARENAFLFGSTST